MNLERTDFLQAKSLRRAAEEPAELGNRVHIRSLRRRRQIADRHVLDHAAAQGAHLGHRGSPVQGWGTPKPWQTREPARRYPKLIPRQRVSSIPRASPSHQDLV